jgi:hydrogenase maturation protease
MTERARAGTVVLGAGNLSMGDDGLGLAVLQRLREGWELPPEVELADGGIWGMTLLPLVEDAGRLIVVDAITAGGRPGSLVELARDELPTRYATRLSPHQVDLRDVFALASLRGTLPAEAVALGLEPLACDWGTDLSPEVSAGVDAVALRVVERLESWGHACRPRVAAA